MKRLAITTIAALLVGACSDGGTGPSASRGEFTAERTVYAPYEVAVLQLNGAAPAAGVSGTLGGEPVMLLPAGDSSVMFMVPRVSGAQALEFSAGSRSYRGTLSVTAFTPVAQPAEYLEAAADEAQAMIAALDLEIEQDTAPVDPAALELLQMARDSLAAFRAHMTGLTPEQVQQVADVMHASLEEMRATEVAALRAGVMHATAQGAIPQECRSEATALDKYSCTWGRFLLSAAKATAAFGGAVLAAEVLAPFPWIAAPTASLFAVFAGVHGYRALTIGKELLRIHLMIAAELAAMVGDAVWQGGTAYFRTNVVDRDATVDPNGFALASLATPPTTMNSFTANSRASFTFEPQMRPVQASDRSLPLEWLARGIDLIGRYNRLVSRFGTRFQLQYATPATSYLAPVPHNQIGIEIVENHNVRVDLVSGENSRVDVVFTTSASGEQEFTYDIVYNSGVFPALRVRFEATLHPSTYRLGALADTTLLGDTVTMHGGGVQNIYFLMLEDGSLAEGHYSLVNTAQVPAGVGYFTVAGNGGHYLYLQGWLQNGTVTADTFDISVVNTDGGRHLLDATVIMVDSAGLYASAIPGAWTATTYWLRSDGTETRDYSEHYQFATGGTGTLRYRTYYTDNQPSETTTLNEPLTWRIRTALEWGVLRHQLRTERANGTGQITLPGYPVGDIVIPWSYSGMSFRTVWSKE